jgi:hypothetical protein
MGVGVLLRRASLAFALSALWAGSAAAADLCSNMNTAGVLNNPPSHRTPCALKSAAHITQLITYHWNGGKGAKPGTILLFNPNTGMQYGPYPASGSSGQGGAPNVNWTANVNLNLPAGSYQIIDSDFATWSWNQGSGGDGFAKAEGDYTGAATTPLPPAPTPTPPPASGVLTHSPCHANSVSYVELAKPTCFGPPGAELTLYVSRYGMTTRPTVAYFRSGAGYNAISTQLGGAMNTPGLSAVFSAALTLRTGNGLEPDSTYTFRIPPGTCFSGASHTWWFDLWVPGSGDVDAVAVRC